MELYTWAPDSFEKKLPDGVVKAAGDNIYGAFRIQCLCANIQYRSFASNKYAAWLFLNKSAFKILIKIMKEAFKREREGKPSIFDWNRFVYNVFVQKNLKLEIIEEILNAFKDEFSDAERRIAEIVKESRFVERTYGIHMIENAHDPKRVYEMFERVFPGSDLFPNPEGTWTDPKDGKTYETLKIKQGIEVMRVPYGNPMTMDKAITSWAIPNGWRFVTGYEADMARQVGAWKRGSFPERFVASHSYTNYRSPIADSIFLFPTYSKVSGLSQPSGIYASRWECRQLYVVLDSENLIHVHYQLGENGIKDESTNPLTCKVSLMLCRELK